MVYTAQLRAFLEAAEVVDVDPDVIEDLLEGLQVESDEGEDGDVDVEEEEEEPNREQDRMHGESGGRPEASARDQADASGSSEDDEEEADAVDEEWAAYLHEGMLARPVVARPQGTAPRCHIVARPTGAEKDFRGGCGRL